MTGNQQQFLNLLRDDMKPSGRPEPLFRFLDRLTFGDLTDCASSYFEHDAEYVHQRAKLNAVFLKLAEDLLAKGDVYFALRLEIALRAPPWQSRYTALSATGRATLNRRVEHEKRKLTAVQRQFIDLFDHYMHKQLSQQKLEGFTSKLKTFQERHDCLFAYVEVSQGYGARNGHDSLLIFLGLSRAAIWLGDAAFTQIYQSKVAEKNTPWHERYAALSPEWRQLIEGDIRDKKTIRSDVEYKGKIHKGAEVGHYDFGPVTPAKTQPAAPSQPQASGKAVAEFLKRYRQFVARGDRHSMDQYQNFLRVQAFEDLRACVEAYLKDSSDQGTATNPRSLVMFFGVLSRALTKGDAYYAFKVKYLTQTAGTVWNQRYMALDQKMYRDRLKAQIEEEIAKKGRLLDDLKAAYYSRFQADPDLQALQTFEPPLPNPAQIDNLAGALSDCETAVAVRSIENFERAFDSLAKILASEKDSLTLWVLAKRCRERAGLDARFRNLFYLYGVGLLFINALQKRPVVYTSGFNAQERECLLGGGRFNDPYFADFVLALEYVMWKKSGAPTLSELCKGQGLLQIYADRYRLFLTPMMEGATLLGSVERLWEKKNHEMAAIRIPVMSRRDGKKELRIGQTIGNYYILFWDFEREMAYLLVNGLDKVVFEARAQRLAEIYDDDALYGEIVRGTAAILPFLDLLWQVVLYMPDLVSGGLTGLAKSIIFNYAFEKSTEALGVDGTQAQLFMLGLSLLVHGTKPKEVDAAEVEHQFSAAEHHLEPNASAVNGQNRMIDATGTQGTGATSAAIHAGQARIGTEMRGIERPGGMIEIRGAETPTGETRVGTEMRGIEGPAATHEIRGFDPGTEAGSPGGAAHGKDASHTTADPRATDDHGSQDRATDAGDRDTADSAAHNDPAGRANQDQGLKEHQDRWVIGEGISGREKKSIRAPRGKQSSPPLPPHVRDRFTQGTWSQHGEIHVNEGGLQLRRPSKTPAANWLEYERGFDEQLAEPLAKEVSAPNKRVVKLGPEDQGYRSSSSGTTNRLKMQKTYKAPEGLMDRRPDASMEVIENLPNKGKKVAEVHYFEATLQTDFETGVAGRGHKQRQLAGTIWLSQGRTGYSPDTRIYYHIIAPGPPTGNTLAYLQKVLDLFPNLEINWFVVPK